MFLVEYQTRWETHVDLGRCVLVADDAEDARQKVLAKYNLPAKRTQTKVDPIEDGMMLLTKRSVTHQAAPSFNNLAGLTGPVVDMPRPVTLPFNCQVLAVVHGTDESHALKRLAHALINRCNEQVDDRDKHVSRMMIQCEARVSHEKGKSWC